MNKRVKVQKALYIVFCSSFSSTFEKKWPSVFNIHGTCNTARSKVKSQKRTSIYPRLFFILNTNTYQSYNLLTVTARMASFIRYHLVTACGITHDDWLVHALTMKSVLKLIPGLHKTYYSCLLEKLKQNKMTSTVHNDDDNINNNDDN